VRRKLSRLAVLLSTLWVAGCLGTGGAVRGSRPPRAVTTLTLVGQFSIPALERFPPVSGLPFGGLSGLSRGPDGEVLAISDVHNGGRIYRLSIEGLSDSLRVTPIQVIPLDLAPGNGDSDNEGLAALPNGHFLVSSEGTGREPRTPPGIVEYGAYGQFVRRLPVPHHYVPEPTGTLTTGTSANAGFESLTLSPDGARLFTATESALVQDGAAATFDLGTQARILEYVARAGTYAPRREFVYEIEAVDRPAYKPGAAINGLVELLALDRNTLLALERGYVEDAGKTGPSGNHICIYRITLDGATDVSKLPTLKEQTNVVPVKKTLLVDLSRTPGLSPDLAPSLDNFEGMAFGPRLPDGRASLVLVSDDNFNTAQRTWFLVFAIE
jgi:hypothetical protein